jgi:hypothetical protein
LALRTTAGRMPRTTTPIQLLVLALTAALGSGCSGMSVWSDFDPTAVDGMKAYRTYSWLPTPKGQRRGADPLLSKRIMAVTDEVLSKKGYERAQTAAPDFLVGWQGAVDRKLQYNTVNTYYGYGWGYWGGVGATRTYATEYHEGSLIIDIVDAKSNELVWRGVAQAEVYPQSDPEYRNRQIESAVNAILSKFPPDE